jgi:hypothetical protein
MSREPIMHIVTTGGLPLLRRLGGVVWASLFAVAISAAVARPVAASAVSIEGFWAVYHDPVSGDLDMINLGLLNAQGNSWAVTDDEPSLLN